MSSLKRLASQTVVYGLSTILARLLNFALTPLHTSVIAPADYGVLNDVYSLIAFFMVILTFGMETAFFRFNRDHSLSKVFSNSTYISLGFCLIFILLFFAFTEPLAAVLRFEKNPQYLIYMILIVAMDALAAVPFAKLRAEGRPFRFLVIRLSTIGVMVLLNLAFFLLFPWMLEQDIASGWILSFYEPGLGVSYVFIANLIGNVLMILLFLPDFKLLRQPPDPKFTGRLMRYAAPLVVGFLAGIANEKAQYQFMKYLLPQGEYEEAQGIFGAMMKIATFMVLFIQAFRFAAEPFFFSREGDFKEKMSRVLRYFVIIQSLIFLGLICFTKVLQWTHFINEQYWEGWHIVPILLFANLLLGINFNLNIWYKVRSQTRMGAYIAFVGLAFTIGAHLLLVPDMGYLGSAWATLISYASMTIYAFYLNQKHDRTNYPVRAILQHLSIAVGLAYLSFYVLDAALGWGMVIFASYTIYLILTEGRAIKNAFQR